MNPVEIIRKKRSGAALSRDELEALVKLGMKEEELADLTAKASSEG